MNACVFYLFINFPAFVPLSLALSQPAACPSVSLSPPLLLLLALTITFISPRFLRLSFGEFPQVFLQSGQQQFLMLTKFELNLPTAQGCSLNCQSAFAAVYVFSYFPFSTPFFPNLHPPGAFNLRTTSASNSTSDSTRHLALACHLPLSHFPAQKGVRKRGLNRGGGW